MYEDFYGLTEKPFSIQPDPSFLYWGRGHRLAYAMLEYGVVNQAGISVITGEVGCGKTTLIHRLLEQLSETHTVALLSNIQQGRGDLLSWVLMGFGEPFAGKTHVELFAQLQQFFIREYSKGRRAVLIIDEAQNLSVDMLEELRMLSNINAGKDQLLQLILVGQPQLKDLLSRPDMLQLAQRIGSDFHLSPLSREEVHSYVETRLTIAGANRRIFSDAALDLIAEQSRGVPRVINIIADTALVYAFSAQDQIVSEETIRAVIRDKLDYGVFGLATSPNLKLTEWREPRAAAGFIREVAAEPRRAQEASAVESGARVTRNMGVRLVSPEPAPESEPEPEIEPEPDIAPELLLRAAPEPIGGPSLYAHTEYPIRAVFPAPQIQAAGEARLAPVRSAAPVVPAAPEPAPAVEEVALSEIGVIIVGGDLAVAQSLQSLPDGAAFVVAAPAGEPGAAAAKEAGVAVVEVTDGAGAGRIFNAGYRRLKKDNPGLRYVQFLGAGVTLAPGWLEQAERFMARRPEVAVLEGLTTVAENGATLFDRVSAALRSAPAGEIQTAGPNAFFRAEAFEKVGGFRADIEADAVADICLRLRRRGAHVWRSEAPMAEIETRRLTFTGFRREAAQRGYAYAAGAALHGAPPERFGVREQARAFFWGGFAPALAVLAVIALALASDSFGVSAFVGAVAALIGAIAVYSLKIAVTALRADAPGVGSLPYALFTTLGYFSEFSGVMRYWFGGGAGAKGAKAG